MKRKIIDSITKTKIKQIQDEINEQLKKTLDGRMYDNFMYCILEKVEDGTGAKRHFFFTRAEAVRYIEQSSCEPYLYVKSGNHNEGWKYARELILEEGES